MPEWRHRLEPFDSPRIMRYRRVAGIALVAGVALAGLPARQWTASSYLIAVAVLGLTSTSLLAHWWAHQCATKACGAVSSPREDGHPASAKTSALAAAPRSDAIAAGAGPLVTAAVAAASALLMLVFRPIAVSLATVFGLVALANAALLAISLLPAYPLDGGRLLRALIWRVTDDRLAGTRLMAWYGQALGWGLMGGGILLLGGSPDPLGAVVALVGGWLLRLEARAGYQSEKWRELSQRIPVYRATFLRAPRLDRDRPLVEAIEDVLAAAGRQAEGGPALAIDSTGLVVGVIGLDDIRHAGRANWSAMTVGDAMTPREAVVTVAQSLAIGTVLEELDAAGARYALVTADGGREPIGVLSKDKLERRILQLVSDRSHTWSERAS